MTKTCSVCIQELAFSEFYKDKRGKQGLYAKCKKCHRGACNWNLQYLTANENLRKGNKVLTYG